jgi:hypothetical protein
MCRLGAEQMVSALSQKHCRKATRERESHMKQMKQMKHWQDPVNALLGAWLIVSPWLLGFSKETTTMSNMVVIGVALIAVALGAIFVPQAWEEWTEAALGLWLMVSPWVLGFTHVQAARDTAVLTGVVVLALAIWVLFSDKDWGLLRDGRTAG